MKSLKIYFTTDVHGYIFPTDYRDSIPKNRGLLALKPLIDKQDNTLIIDGGDAIQGSPFMTYFQQSCQDLTSTLTEIHPLAHVMNTLGYDYVTLGNHDFNYGYNALKTYVNGLDAKCLSANILDLKNEISIFSYDIKTLENGLKVGIIGLTTDYITVWEHKETLENFEIHTVYDTLIKIYERVKSQCDFLIGLYHGGFENDLKTHKQLSSSHENIAFQICRDFEFDLLLTGHQHMSVINQSLFGTHIVQLADGGTQMAQIEILCNEQNQLETIKTKALFPSYAHLDQTLYYQLLPIESRVQKWLDAPIGHLNQPLIVSTHLEMALKGNLICNFINQIQLDATGADISCTALGNDIKGFNTSVTIRDVVSTYIYPNTLMVIQITGEILKKALEHCASYFEVENGHIVISNRFLKPKIEHYNYDYFTNINYTFDLKNPIGNRVVTLLFRDQPVKANDVFTLALNNYRASGTGGYEFYKSCPVLEEFPVEMTEIIIQYFYDHPAISVDGTQYYTFL